MLEKIGFKKTGERPFKPGMMDNVYELTPEVKPSSAAQAGQSLFVPEQPMSNSQMWQAWLTSGGPSNPDSVARNKIVYVTLAVQEPVTAEQIAEFSGESVETVVRTLDQWKGAIQQYSSPNG